MNNPPQWPSDPNFHAQDTAAGQYPQFPSNPGQFSQSGPNFPQPGQFGPPPLQPPPLPHQRLWVWFQRLRSKKALGIGCGILIGMFMLCSVCAAIGNALPKQRETATAPIATEVPTPKPKPKPTHKPKPTATPTPKPTPTPTPTPTPSPTPTPTPTPVPPPPPPAPPVQQQPAPPPPSSGGDKDCKDFATQAQAQNYFNSHGGSKTNNVDGLDADHDGIACESLP